ncbi:MAG: elongation factor 1-beta, partial [Candidatus Aenigmarchaeota archaeon]|nr:elongation factor 1-beta [Candidatus Aenigmarchaeota archaeon]
EKHEIHPVAFGLKALLIYIIVPDSAGTDDLGTKLRAIPHVQSVEVVDVRRAL